MVGGAVFAGATGAAATTCVCAELALLDPAELLAVTRTRIVEPTSAEVSVYVCPVNGTMSTQLVPPESQRRH